MRRRRAILLTTASLAVIGSVWFGPELLGATMTPEIVTISTGTVTDRSEELARCRLSGAIEALDAFVAAQQTRVQERASDPAEYRVLAEAHLERCLMRDTRRGMAVGKPTHTELPEPHRQDIEAGLAAVDAALAHGDTTADVHRIRSSLLSLQITGLGTALSLRPKVAAALKSAEAIDPTHPRIVIARACEKLFAPSRFLGQDPAAAERMFLRAADALRLDERPLVFAAMCAELQGRRTDAIAALEKAIERNPNNHYAATVLQRLRAAEPDAFARDT